jgi:uncharacterized repeat protein (TIGR01451 family)
MLTHLRLEHDGIAPLNPLLSAKNMEDTMTRRILVVFIAGGGMLLAFIGLVYAQDAGPQSAEANQADVSLAVTPSANVVLPGDNLTYTFAVSNTGPQTATNVIMSATLPMSWTFISGSITQGSCSYSGSTQRLNCSFGNIARGYSATLILNGEINAAAICPATMTFTTSVSGDFDDPNIANNTATSSVHLFCNQADMSLAVTPSANVVLPGDNLAYTFVVSDTGPQTATNVIMSATLPAPWVFISGSITQGSCTLSGSTQRLNCSFGNIARGYSATVILNGKINAAAICPATMTFTTSVSSAFDDPNITDNTATSSVHLFCNRLYLPVVLR